MSMNHKNEFIEQAGENSVFVKTDLSVILPLPHCPNFGKSFSAGLICGIISPLDELIF